MCSVVGHQAFRPTKRARRKSVLAGFQGLQLGDGSFKATFEDGFCEHRRKTRERVVRRIATVTGEQLKVAKCRAFESALVNKSITSNYNCILLRLMLSKIQPQEES